jgi:LETM1 and EF-hand domain-containing protein 1, mitochondrial
MNDQVPPSLLLLSRAMYFPEEQNFTDRLKTVITLLPKQIGEHTTLKLKEIEGMTDPKARLELLKSIEVALKQEAEEAKERAVKKDEESEKEKV